MQWHQYVRGYEEEQRTGLIMLKMDRIGVVRCCTKPGEIGDPAVVAVSEQKNRVAAAMFEINAHRLRS